ncbi:PREDICTED: uncharacterized protein LOC105566781 isoform X1 [Vollenhovia emeryi]|uniref:uncharacterized protein LOC105566781 isoform X1 n=1 Tax=Vollenhovia emeryi TaxID=411798 RepID=UPI0005F4A539|nr:PREDICTED: uncharacterized protein LOC105566781 isoform X1 [Vollenhovia emeryi]
MDQRIGDVRARSAHQMVVGGDDTFSPVGGWLRGGFIDQDTRISLKRFSSRGTSTPSERLSLKRLIRGRFYGAPVFSLSLFLSLPPFPPLLSPSALSPLDPPLGTVVQLRPSLSAPSRARCLATAAAKTRREPRRRRVPYSRVRAILDLAAARRAKQPAIQSTLTGQRTIRQSLIPIQSSRQSL